ncbi:hypothetical protein BH11PSE8_BH11PSE8_26220 [soil metagenome]
MAGVIDWSVPWLVPWRAIGEPVAEQAGHDGVVAALNAAAQARGAHTLKLDAGRLHFVPQDELPAAEAYEAFIARTACVPTRENLHDLLNGIAWLLYPALKRRLNELHAAELAARGEVGSAKQRGAVRDALTVFDENAALWQAPAVLVHALRERDWHRLFVTHRHAWADAQLTLFGHALVEKLTQPRKAITAHLWLLPEDATIGTPEASNVVDAMNRFVPTLAPALLATKPYLPLPVLGVPGWWPENERAGFYEDAEVFRPPRATAGRR